MQKKEKHILQSTSITIIEELKSSSNEEENRQDITNKELKKEAKKRAKDRPIIKRMMQVFYGKEEPYREIIINSEPLERRVALLVNGVLERFEVERVNEQPMVGAIFQGKIQNHERGLKAAFVNIGQPKNAFLHYWDILPSAEDSAIEIISENKSHKGKQKEQISLSMIPDQYPIGTEVIVQITKARIGNKGPRTTTNISIPGRYLVLMPYSGQFGISRKIDNQRERDRLKKILCKLAIPEDMGIIVRTAGEGKKLRYFIRDLSLLLKKWREILAKIKNNNQPFCIYQEPNILERTIRDLLTEEIDRVIIDNTKDYKLILSIVKEVFPNSKSIINMFQENIPIFERFNIESQIYETFQRKVPLPSGGEIIIEETEALTAIDVNTGSHKGKTNDGKDYIFQCNLEAACEAARQIRLRNIGGLIILDFIDMKNRRNRKGILDCMRIEMKKDKAKAHILPISQLGIMQMTRQRNKKSISSGIYTSCPYCSERGIVKSTLSISVEIQRQIVSILRRLHNKNSYKRNFITILLHPINLERLRQEDRLHLARIENTYNANLSFLADSSYHVENFKILNSSTNEELK